MNSLQSFFLGFGAATLIGILSAFILAGLGAITSIWNNMFNNPPNPKLTSDGRVDTTIKLSPVQVMLDGFIRIIGHFILYLALFTIQIISVWFVFQQQVTVDFLFGIFFAGVFGLLLQNIRVNWLKILQLFRGMFSPPVPALNNATPPNNHYLRALPPIPAFWVIVNNSVEIFGRAVLLLILFALFFQTSVFAGNYVTSIAEPTFRVFAT